MEEDRRRWKKMEEDRYFVLTFESYFEARIV